MSYFTCSPIARAGIAHVLAVAVLPSLLAQNTISTYSANDVRHYGAIGDGRTDASVAILEAIAATHGGPIVFPTGTFLITQSIVWSSLPAGDHNPGLRMTGAGPGKTIFDCQVANGACIDIRQPKTFLFSKDGLISGIELRGNFAKIANQTGLQVRGAWDYTLEDLVIRGFSGDGIRCPGVPVGTNSDGQQSGLHIRNTDVLANDGVGIDDLCSWALSLDYTGGEIESNAGGGIFFSGAGMNLTNVAIASNGTGANGYGLMIDRIPGSTEQPRDIVLTNIEMDSNTGFDMVIRNGTKIYIGTGTRFIAHGQANLKMEIPQTSVFLGGMIEHHDIVNNVEFENATWRCDSEPYPCTLLGLGESGTIGNILITNSTLPVEPRIIQRYSRALTNADNIQVWQDNELVDASVYGKTLWSVDPAGKAVVAAGIQLKNDSLQPLCTSSTRGTLWNRLGTSGQPDEIEACLRNGAGDYVWNSLKLLSPTQ